MPAEPLRERTMAAIAAQLATIQEGTVVYPDTTVDYWTTPSLITRSLLWIPQYDRPLTSNSSITQLDAGPVLGVVRSSGSTFERLLHVDPAAAATGLEHMQRLTIWGYVKGTASVLAGTLLERLWQDVYQCLLVDPTFGSVALDSKPDGTLDTDDGALEPLGYFAQDWVVIA